MNNGTSEVAQSESSSRAPRSARAGGSADELTRLKQELLQAEVRFAKARATAVGAEIDIKVLNARLREFLK